MSGHLSLIDVQMPDGPQLLFGVLVLVTYGFMFTHDAPFDWRCLDRELKSAINSCAMFLSFSCRLALIAALPIPALSLAMCLIRVERCGTWQSAS